MKDKEMELTTENDFLEHKNMLLTFHNKLLEAEAKGFEKELAVYKKALELICKESFYPEDVENGMNTYLIEARQELEDKDE